VQFTPGRVAGKNVTARQIILEAYRLKTYQLTGGPGWLDEKPDENQPISRADHRFGL